MNCWIILLLLCCSGKNNGASVGNTGCGCGCHEHNHCNNSCIQPRMWERDSCDCNVRRERDCDCDEHEYHHDHDDCGCSGEDRVRDKWMPYKDYNDNDRRDCNCKQQSKKCPSIFTRAFVGLVGFNFFPKIVV